MKETPILFSTPMVQAIMKDTKTIGEDFSDAERINSYPIRVYRLKRVANASKQSLL
jgi:hypothetical protein